MYLQPFDKHPANVGALRQQASELLDLSVEAVELANATRGAYAPALANWHGMGAPELAAAAEPLQRDAQAARDDLVLAALAGQYWASRVEGFNAQVDVITAGLGSQAASNYGATGTGGAPPTVAQIDEARAGATAAAKQQWMQAHAVWIEDGRQQAKSMLERGLTEQNVAELRDAGIVPGGGAFDPRIWAGVTSVVMPGVYLGSLGSLAGQPPAPPVGGTPAQNAAWWASLSAGARATLLATRPGMLGNLAGLPASVRHQANVTRLGTERSRIKAEIARLEGVVAQKDRGPGGRLVTHEEREQIRELQRKLASLDAIETTIGKGDRQLLLLDLSGERAEAAVAIGDIDTAKHVAVFTPGFTTTVDGNGLNGYDEQMAQLQEEANRQAYESGGGAVATVTWIGYQAPQWGDTLSPSESVLSQDSAERGADDLAQFYRGINASRAASPEPTDPHLTAIGHSYGATTTGLAVQQPGTGVDDVVFAAPPGVGTSDVDDLHVPEGHAYVVEARNDPIADAGMFGDDPNKMDGMTGLSAREETVGGREYAETTGHYSGDANGYLTSGTSSQYNISVVVAGKPEWAVHDDAIGVGDVWRD